MKARDLRRGERHSASNYWLKISTTRLHGACWEYTWNLLFFPTTGWPVGACHYLHTKKRAIPIPWLI